MDGLWGVRDTCSGLLAQINEASIRNKTKGGGGVWSLNTWSQLSFMKAVVAPDIKQMFAGEDGSSLSLVV